MSKKILEKTLSTYQEQIEHALAKELDSLDGLVSENLLQAIKYASLDGGKRLRPTLALIVAEAVLEDELSFLENPAAAFALGLELVHSGSLVHDDLPCMDDDDLRRGRPSTHKKFDEATALLAGDFLMVYPLRLVLEKTDLRNSRHIEKQYSTVIQNTAAKFGAAIQDMIFGQALDMDFSTKRIAESEELLRKMQAGKTGALLTASIELAAYLAGAEAKSIKHLASFAQNLGLAFQISDDVLDQVSSSEILGKTSGKDLEQNKMTFVSLYGLEKAQEIAADLIKEAKKQLSLSGVNADKLEMLADYVISRNY